MFVGQNLKRGRLYKLMLGRQPKRRTYLTDTFQSEDNDHSSSHFMVDRTLYKGIKENDVSKIIDISNDGGTLGENALPSEEQELENIVVEMRKRYDEVKTNTTNLQNEIEKSRKAMDLLKTEENRLQDYIQSTRTQYEQTKDNCQNLINAVETIVYDFDIYKEMQKRLKKDILVMKKRNFDKEAMLKKGNIKAKTLRQEEFTKTKLSYKCRDMLQSIERTVTSKQQERTTKINSFYDALNRRHQNLIKREERERQIEEVMMKAMSQKLQEEKEWMNICAVNIFLKKFLKNKMERLIQQNSQIETAYHQIRSNTEIKDCKDLITKFLNRERDYGILLQSISDKERRLEELKQQKEELQRLDQALIQEADEIQESVGLKGGSLEPLQKDIQGVQEILRTIEEKEELMSKWAFKFLCTFYGKSKEYYQKTFESKSVKDLLTTALNDILKYTDRILGEQNCSDKINNAFMSTRPSGKIFGDQMLVRNKRVKTTAMEESNAEEDREAFYDGNSEAEFLHYNRRVTKKNDYNRRFRIKTQLK